jgi:hypothetical protein
MKRESFFTTIVLAFILSGCCTYQASKIQPWPDRFETQVMIGFGKPPTCCILPPSLKLAILAKKGEQRRIWIRSVYFDQVLKPISGVPVRFEIVDAFGEVVSTAIISHSSTESTVLGFAKDEIYFEAHASGTFRIRAIYRDRRNESISLSQLIIVI